MTNVWMVSCIYISKIECECPKIDGVFTTFNHAFEYAQRKYYHAHFEKMTDSEDWFWFDDNRMVTIETVPLNPVIVLRMVVVK